MVRIITDSGADFEPHELKEKGIVYIPLFVYFGETLFSEGVYYDSISVLCGSGYVFY